MATRLKTIAEREWNSKKFDTQCEQFINNLRKSDIAMQSLKVTFKVAAGQPDCIWLVCFIEWFEVER